MKNLQTSNKYLIERKHLKFPLELINPHLLDYYKIEIKSLYIYDYGKKITESHSINLWALNTYFEFDNYNLFI